MNSLVSAHRCRSTPSPTPYRRDAKVWRRDQNVDLVIWRPNDLVRSRRQNNGLGLERSFSFNIAAISTESVLRSSLYAYATVDRADTRPPSTRDRSAAALTSVGRRNRWATPCTRLDGAWAQLGRQRRTAGVDLVRQTAAARHRCACIHRGQQRRARGVRSSARH